MPAIELTTTQRRYLKQQSHHLKPIIHMGKEGPTEAFMGQLAEQLEAHELLKIKVLNNLEISREGVEAPLAEADITLVQKVGHIYTVYKKREVKPTLNLPKH